MPGANGGEHEFGGNGAAWVSLHRVINTDHLVPQPPFDGSVTLL
jgi:hypothetical protein